LVGIEIFSDKRTKLGTNINTAIRNMRGLFYKYRGQIGGQKNDDKPIEKDDKYLAVKNSIIFYQKLNIFP
jgi:hypothetical protein